MVNAASPSTTTNGFVNTAADPFDAVIVATPDLAGRLLGRRHSWPHYQASASKAVNTCEVVFGWGLGHELLDGFSGVGWDHGYGDLRFVTDPDTLRPVGWQDGVGIAFADVVTGDGTPFFASPRNILRTQIERAHSAGYRPLVTSELEFFALRNTSEVLAQQGFTGLTPVRGTLQPELACAISADETIMAELFSAMQRTGIEVETAKTEYCPGQYEVTLVPTDPMRMADQHALYKMATREIFRRHGMSATFMAKVDDHWAGSSSHLHVSLTDDDGNNLFATDEHLLRRFGAGLQAFARDFFLLWAPYPNSYKRFRDGTFAPTALTWGDDNRTVALRVTGHGSARHLENRIPGADINPYLGYAALLAAGLEGIERGLLPSDEVGQRNAYTEKIGRPLPESLSEALDAFYDSPVTRETLGEAAVEHITTFLSSELRASQLAVTDWDRRRLFDL